MTRPRLPRRSLPLLGIAALAAIPYLPTLRNSFVWDDLPHIEHNARIESVAGVRHYLTHSEGAYYRPAVFASYALDYGLWGRRPAGYHLTNLLLHALDAVLLVEAAVATGLSRRAALAAGAIFATHPLQSEAVAYVSGRTDLLMTAGALAAWRALNVSRGAAARGCVFALGVALAVLSKETGYGFLLLVPWAVWRGGARWRRRAVVVAPGVAVALALLAVRPGPLPSPELETVGDRLPAAGRALGMHAALFFWPASLRIDRLTPVGGGPVGTGAGVVGLAAACGLTVWALRRRGSGADWTAWSVAFYLPVANIFPLYPAIADRALFTPEHNLYAPLAGLAVLGALCVRRAWLAAGLTGRRVLAWATAVAVGLLAFRTAVRTGDWQDEERLYSRAVRSGSESPRVWFNLGNILLGRGEVEEAVAAYRGALQRSPRDPQVWMNLGVAFQRQGLLDQALAAYRRAASLSAPSALLLENLGTLHLARGELAAAHQAFSRALAIDPGRRKAREALGLLGRGVESSQPD